MYRSLGGKTVNAATRYWNSTAGVLTGQDQTTQPPTGQVQQTSSPTVIPLIPSHPAGREGLTLAQRNPPQAIPHIQPIARVLALPQHHPVTPSTPQTVTTDSQVQPIIGRRRSRDSETENDVPPARRTYREAEPIAAQIPQRQRRAEPPYRPLPAVPPATPDSLQVNDAIYLEMVNNLRTEIDGLQIDDRFHPEDARTMFHEDLDLVFELHQAGNLKYDSRYLQDFRRNIYYAIRQTPPGDDKPFFGGRAGIANPTLTYCPHITEIQIAAHERVYDYFFMRPRRAPFPMDQMDRNYDTKITQLEQFITTTHEEFTILQSQKTLDFTARNQRKAVRDSHAFQSDDWRRAQADYLTIDTQISRKNYTNRIQRLRATYKDSNREKDELTTKRDQITRYRRDDTICKKYLNNYLPALRESMTHITLNIPEEEMHPGYVVPIPFYLKEYGVMGSPDWLNKFKQKLQTNWRVIRVGGGLHWWVLVRNPNGSMDRISDAHVRRNYYHSIDALINDFSDRAAWDRHQISWMD